MTSRESGIAAGWGKFAKNQRWRATSTRTAVCLSSLVALGCSSEKTDTGAVTATDGRDTSAAGPGSSDGSGSVSESNGVTPVTPTATSSGSDDSTPSQSMSGATPTPDGTGAEPSPPQVPVTEANKLDLLLVVDNSANMPEKAALFAESVEYLLEQLVHPPCVDANGTLTTAAEGECPAGSTFVHAPLDDIHVGVITTSLGSYGAERNCVVDPTRVDTLQNDDSAHLVGSLSRGQALSGDFLTRQPNSAQPLADFYADIESHISAAGEHGCGFEGSLESWVRFLVDPTPYTRIVRVPCSPTDSSNSCNGPERDANGTPLVDETLLAQRAAFLRPDSLVGIVVLTDENDCSVRTSGQSWIVTDQQDNSGTFRGSAACETDPNDPCCQSCGMAAVSGCPTEVNGEALGCTELTYPIWNPVEGGEDSPNLRCFHQKRRFGYDFLFPVERYVNALTQRKVCPSDTLQGADGDSCDQSAAPDNALWVNNGAVRPAGHVFFATIAGVPWQDLAVNPGAEVLSYRKPTAADSDEELDWDLLLGARDASSERRQYPLNDGVMDPLLFESVEPRTGVNAPTGAALAAPTAAYQANPINGHEWNIVDQAALQHSCLMPLRTPETCLSEEEQIELSADGSFIHSCQCAFFGNEDYRSPACQAPDGSYGLTKYFSGAFPPTRLLQVQERLTTQNTVTGVVGSVCAKSVDAAVDSGYKPTMDALLAGFRARLE